MKLKETWNSQYDDKTKTALKDENLFKIEKDAILHWIEKKLSEKQTHDPVQIMELGCGTGELIKEINQSVEYNNQEITLIGVDFSDRAILLAKEKKIPNWV